MYDEPPYGHGQMNKEVTMQDIYMRLDLFEKIVNRTYDAVIIVDEERKIAFWNPAAEEIFGFPAEAVIGKDMHSLITPERYRERANAAHTRYKKTGQGEVLGKRVEIEALNSIGQEFWVELSINDVVVDGRRWAFAIIRDISKRKKVEQVLEQQAQTDPLSGLYNRRAFRRLLDDVEDNGISVALVDIDDFKQINDQAGHEAGDQAIMVVSQAMRRVFDDAICLARLGGDEFAIILIETGSERLEAKFAEFTRSTSETFKKRYEDLELNVSIGISVDSSGKAGSREMLSRADKALYRAKESGKNQVAFDAT